MIKKLLPFIILVFLFFSCNSAEKENEANELSQPIETVKPINPKIETDYGQIGEYHTIDEYYIDQNGDKIWHGYRKNLYPTLSPKLISYYEHGEEIWTETYDDVGNVLSSNR